LSRAGSCPPRPPVSVCPPSRRSRCGVDTSGTGHSPVRTGPVHDEGAARPAKIPDVRPCPDFDGAARGRYRRQRDEDTVIPDPAAWLDHRLRIVHETYLRVGGQCRTHPLLDLDGDGIRHHVTHSDRSSGGARYRIDVGHRRPPIMVRAAACDQGKDDRCVDGCRPFKIAFPRMPHEARLRIKPARKPATPARSDCGFWSYTWTRASLRRNR
jgi:hypothetical protein